LSTTRERILDVTAELFRRYGYTGTGLKQIVQNARAPFGSLYHFFPGGQDELAAAVIRRSGRMYLELWEAIADAAPDPISAVADFFDGAAEVLRQTDFADACPIATVALEVASRNDALRQATAEVFESWTASLALRLEGASIPKAEARALAIFALAALEGAFVLSRAARSTEPMDVARAAVIDRIRGVS